MNSWYRELTNKVCSPRNIIILRTRGGTGKIKRFHSWDNGNFIYSIYLYTQKWITRIYKFPKDYGNIRYWGQEIIGNIRNEPSTRGASSIQGRRWDVTQPTRRVHQNQVQYLSPNIQIPPQTLLRNMISLGLLIPGLKNQNCRMSERHVSRGIIWEIPRKYLPNLEALAGTGKKDKHSKACNTLGNDR